MSFVQSNSNGSGHNANVATFAVAFSVNVTAHSCLVADFSWQDGFANNGTAAVTDSLGSTWTRIFRLQNATTGLWIESWYTADVAAGANTVTVAYTGTNSFTDIGLAVHEYANIDRATPVDAYNVAAWTTGTSITPSITTGYANDILHTFCCIRPNSFLGYPGAAWNIRENNSGYVTLLSCDQPISTPAGSTQSASFYGNNDGTVFPFGAALIALKNTARPAPGSTLLVINDPVIGATDRSSYLKIGGSRFNSTLRQRGTADVELIAQIGDTYLPTTGTQILLYDKNQVASYLAFAGVIDVVEVTFLGDLGARLIKLTVVSLEKCFDTLLVPPRSFFYAKAEDIFTSLLNSVANGVPVVPGTINAPFVINRLDCDWTRLSDVFNEIATAAKCIWGVDPITYTVFLKPANATAAPFTFNSVHELWGSNRWEQNQQDYRNRQIIRISPDAFSQSAELFTCNGSQNAFQLKRPVKDVTFAWTTKNTQNTATGTFTANPANGDTISITYPQTGSIYNWAPNAPYSTGQVIVDPANHVQVVTTAGKSGGSQPAWNDVGGTTVDFQVIWQDRGLSGAGGIGASIYTFVTVLDNRVWGQVLIGSNATSTVQHFCDAVNSTQSAAGQTFSWPTWENALVNADEPAGGLVVTIRNKNAGSGYVASLSDVCAVFAWAASATAGGSTVLGTVSLQVAAEGSSNTANLYYTPGNQVVTVPIAPASGLLLQVQYRRAGGDVIVVEDSAEVAIRAVLENGTGRYQQIVEDSAITSTTIGLQRAQATLAAFCPVIPILFSFKTFRPALATGQWITITFANTPVGITTLIPAASQYVIQEISAELMPIYSKMDPQVPSGGRYEYTVTVINVDQVSDAIQFWKDLGGGGGGGGGLASGGGIQLAQYAGGYTDVYDVPNISGVFTPDARKMNRILLTADASLAAAINGPTGTGSVTYGITISQDGVGGHNLLSSSSHSFSADILGTGLADTRSETVWRIDNGISVLQAVLTDQKI